METNEILTVSGFLLVWLLFRIERASSRVREMKAAHGHLTGIRESLFGADGWARVFFSTNWTEQLATERAEETAQLIRSKNFEALFRIPDTPGTLEALAATSYAGDLISMETVKWTGIALYKLNLFAHFVDQQGRLVERHLLDIKAAIPGDQKLDDLVQVFRDQSFILHRHGLGEPNAPGGWYWELKDRVEADISRLACDQKNFVYPEGTRPVLITGDALAACAAPATLVVALTT
jgi:hypothetical protein